MDADTIKKIAGESEGKRKEREEIEHKLKILKHGAEICKRYSMQPCGFLPISPRIVFR